MVYIDVIISYNKCTTLKQYAHSEDTASKPRGVLFQKIVGTFLTNLTLPLYTDPEPLDPFIRREGERSDRERAEREVD